MLAEYASMDSAAWSRTFQRVDSVLVRVPHQDDRQDAPQVQYW